MYGDIMESNKPLCMECDRKSYLVDEFEETKSKWGNTIKWQWIEWISWFWIIAAIGCNDKKIVHNIKESE